MNLKEFQVQSLYPIRRCEMTLPLFFNASISQMKLRHFLQCSEKAPWKDCDYPKYILPKPKNPQRPGSVLTIILHLEKGEQISFVFQTIISCFIFNHVWNFTELRTGNKEPKSWRANCWEEQPSSTVWCEWAFQPEGHGRRLRALFSQPKDLGLVLNKVCVALGNGRLGWARWPREDIPTLTPGRGRWCWAASEGVLGDRGGKGKGGKQGRWRPL